MTPRVPLPATALLAALWAAPSPGLATADAASDGVSLKMAPVLAPRMVKPQGGLQSWACPPGLARSGNECAPIAVPDNASLHSSGRIWICNRGYRKVGAACQAVVVPEHASLDEQGTGWNCNYGFVRSGLGCIKRK